MKKLVLALVLAASACLAPADDASDVGPADEEHVAETSAALTTSELDLDPEAAHWLRENIPQWSVYLGGNGRDLHPGRQPWNSFTSVYFDDPRDSDVFAPLIAVRRGDEERPEKWVELNLTRHWLAGQRYFDELVDCGVLTALDLVVLRGELARHADKYVEPRPIHTLPAATREVLRELRGRSRNLCQPSHHPPGPQREESPPPYGPPLPPGWTSPPGPDDHLGPAPGGVGPGGTPLPPNFVPGSNRVSDTQWAPRPAPPRTPEENGVREGDPTPRPAPTDQHYKARPGEERETFKCSGEVYYGYKAGCLDLSNVSLSEKWFTHLGDWLASVPGRVDKLRASLQDKLINTGTHEDCERHCRYVGYAQFAVVVAIIPTACVVLTRSPACADLTSTNGLTQVGTVVAGGTLSTAAQGEVTVECQKHICDGR